MIFQKLLLFLFLSIVLLVKQLSDKWIVQIYQFSYSYRPPSTSNTDIIKWIVSQHKKTALSCRWQGKAGKQLILQFHNVQVPPHLKIDYLRDMLLEQMLLNKFYICSLLYTRFRKLYTLKCM